jgi:hypothetical protein
MDTEKTVRTTAYKEYVDSNLPKCMRVGQGLYNYKEAAELVGLKPTQHFKRRVRDLVKANVLKMSDRFTPTGGIEHCFTFEVTDVTGDFPF